MPSDVYLLVGSPGSGKTWVSDQLKQSYEVVEHDYYKDKQSYVNALVNRAQTAAKPVLGNTPFGLSEIMASLNNRRVPCTPVFIIEHPDILASRYKAREHKPIPVGHLTRQRTYMERALESGAFVGTSEQVLKHLKDKAI